jgi:hypothetical protein
MWRAGRPGGWRRSQGNGGEARGMEEKPGGWRKGQGDGREAPY